MSPVASTSQSGSASVSQSSNEECSNWSEVASALEAAQGAPASPSYQNVLDKTKISLSRPSSTQPLPLELLSSIVAFISHTAKSQGASSAASQEAIALQWSTGLRTSTEARYHVHLLEMWERLELFRPALRYLTEHIPLQALSAICRDPMGCNLVLKLVSLASPCPCNVPNVSAARSARSRELAKEQRSTKVLARKLLDRLGKMALGRASRQDLNHFPPKQRSFIQSAQSILFPAKSTSADPKLRQQSLLLLLQCHRHRPCETCLLSLCHPAKVSCHAIGFIAQHLESMPSFIQSRPQLAHHLWQELADAVIARPILFKAVVRGAQNWLLHEMTRHPSLKTKHLWGLWKEGLRRRRPHLVSQVLDCMLNLEALELPEASFRNMHLSLDAFRLQQPAVALLGVGQISRLATSRLAHCSPRGSEWAHGILRRCAALTASLRGCASDVLKEGSADDWIACPALSTSPNSERERSMLSQHRQRIQFNAKISLLMRRRRGYRRKLRLCAEMILQNKAAGSKNNSVLANIISKVLLDNPHWTSEHIWQFLRHALRIRLHSTMSAQEWHDLFGFMRTTAGSFAKRGDLRSTSQALRLLTMVQQARES